MAEQISGVRNHIAIDHIHSRAITREIGDRLRRYLTDKEELPANLRTQLERFRELDAGEENAAH